MPNWCQNTLVIIADGMTLKEIFNHIRSENSVFDFEKIIPMPDHIYRGALGEKERALYGENNWYDWSCKPWGTKWNSDEASVYGNNITFLTAWSPCSPVIAELASQYPKADFYYRYNEIGEKICGTEEYRNGELISKTEGDYIPENKFNPYSRFKFRVYRMNVDDVVNQLFDEEQDAPYDAKDFGQCYFDNNLTIWRQDDGWYCSIWSNEDLTDETLTNYLWDAYATVYNNEGILISGSMITPTLLFSNPEVLWN